MLADRRDGPPTAIAGRIDIVIPVFNEEATLDGFHRSLVHAIGELPYSFRFLYVNDGSSDSTPDVLAQLSAADARVVPIHLSRNFGHQSALSAGLAACDSDAVVMMDGDGQHPSALIPEM